MTGASNTFFYHNLPADKELSSFTNLSTYVELPSDWYVIIADIKGSTKAIEAGLYKQVNTLGASVIAAVLNVNREIDVPFIFGGDGATFAVPFKMLAGTRSALLGARSLAIDFDMELRIGISPLSIFQENGYHFLIKKIQTSEHISQASFAGDGWMVVEDAIKNPTSRDQYELVQQENEPIVINFEGLECKWQDIHKPDHHKLSIIVAKISDNEDDEIQAFINELLNIYGSIEACHPLSIEQMQLNTSARKLDNEVKVRSFSHSTAFRFFYRNKIRLQAMIGKYYLFKYDIVTTNINGKQYIYDLMNNADVMKFDGMLKMIIDSTDEKTNQLIDYLVKQYREEKIVFGIHRSPAAILTCLIFSMRDKHFHFVDGSDGGYAMAAKQLKNQLKKQLKPHLNKGRLRL